ncbi:MAG: hypothetical protein LBB34_01385 [Holosporales bacterium]|jgi:hypothetical protein|nr:hypothetical protein [Holosporales bacterium]
MNIRTKRLLRVSLQTIVATILIQQGAYADVGSVLPEEQSPKISEAIRPWIHVGTAVQNGGSGTIVIDVSSFSTNLMVYDTSKIQFSSVGSCEISRDTRLVLRQGSKIESDSAGSLHNKGLVQIYPSKDHDGEWKKILGNKVSGILQEGSGESPTAVQIKVGNDPAEIYNLYRVVLADGLDDLWADDTSDRAMDAFIATTLILTEAAADGSTALATLLQDDTFTSGHTFLAIRSPTGEVIQSQLLSSNDLPDELQQWDQDKYSLVPVTSDNTSAVRISGVTVSGPLMGNAKVDPDTDIVSAPTGEDWTVTIDNYKLVRIGNTEGHILTVLRAMIPDLTRGHDKLSGVDVANIRTPEEWWHILNKYRITIDKLDLTIGGDGIYEILTDTGGTNHAVRLTDEAASLPIKVNQDGEIRYAIHSLEEGEMKTLEFNAEGSQTVTLSGNNRYLSGATFNCGLMANHAYALPKTTVCTKGLTTAKPLTIPSGSNVTIHNLLVMQPGTSIRVLGSLTLKA